MQVFDSDEELHFSWYLDELKRHKAIIGYEYHPKPFSLSEKVTHKFLKTGKRISRETEAFLMHPHKYQADFMIYWQAEWEGRLFMCLDGLLSLNYPFITNMGRLGIPYSVIDVKGMFAGRKNNSAVTFPLDQKWVYQRYKIYVQKIIPKELFKETFTPENYLYTDVTRKKRKLNYTPISIGEYLK